MRHVLLSFAFILAVLTAVIPVYAQIPDINGSWTGVSSFGNADRQMSIDLVMHLERSGDQLTGWLALQSDSSKRLEIANGKFDGTAVSFDLLVPDRPQVKMSIQGRLTKDRVEGGFNSTGSRGDKMAGTGTGQITSGDITLEWSASGGDKNLQGKLHFSKK